MPTPFRPSVSRLVACTAVLTMLAACDAALPTSTSLDAGAPSLAKNKATPPPVAVAFTNCVESIGVGLAPTGAVQALVPSVFVLVGQGQPVTPLVVRTSRCTASVDGARAKSGEIVQIGAIIVPPDFTGDVNSALLWYYTSDAKLAHALGSLGVDAQHVPTIDYEVAPGAPGNVRAFAVTVRKPGSPTLSLAGTITESTAPAGAFVANWWTVGTSGTVKMSTAIPSILIGGADLTLTTSATNALGAIVGATNGFPLVQQYNTFATAQMSAAIVP